MTFGQEQDTSKIDKPDNDIEASVRFYDSAKKEMNCELSDLDLRKRVAEKIGVETCYGTIRMWDGEVQPFNEEELYTATFDAVVWNPLRNAEQCARIQAELKINVIFTEFQNILSVQAFVFNTSDIALVRVADDVGAAMRRAIVVAACIK